MQQTHIQNQTHTIPLDCIVVLLCTQGKKGLVMNNLISTWKVTSGFFQKKKSIQAFRREQLVFWMNVFSSQVAGPLEENDHFTTHLAPLHSYSFFPLWSYLTRQKNTSVNRGEKKKQKRWKWYFGLRCSFPEICFTTFRDCLCLYLEQMCTEVPRAQPRTLSLALASFLRSIVKASADGFQWYSKNKNYRWCGGTSCSQHLSSHHF